MMKKVILSTVLALAMPLMCSAQKYVGGDISMLKKFVDEGAVYKDKDGVVVEPLDFFKAQGWNAQRVRLFVDPVNASDDDKKQGAIQDLDYVKALGKQIKDAGFSLMLDFHYSDTWTDPGKHALPAAWKNMTVDQLKQQVYEYTKACLQQMKDAGATPDFIQVGNEITTGMLWNTGRIYAGGGAPSGGSWDNFAAYLASGVKACREVCPDAKVVIHVELHAPSDVPKFYNTLANYPQVNYDIIGLSYYPDYHGKLSVLDGILTSLESQHADKQIMVVETGYGFEWQLPGAKENLKDSYPLSQEGQRKFAADLIALLDKHHNVNGLFWWYPEYTLNNIVYKTNGEDWNKNFTSGYWNAALFHYKTGKANTALYELKNFIPADQTGIENVERRSSDAQRVYDLQGRCYGTSAVDQLPRGLYVVDGRKVVGGR